MAIRTKNGLSEVVCDGCGRSTGTKVPAEVWERARIHAYTAHWICTLKDRDFCPECQAKETPMSDTCEKKLERLRKALRRVESFTREEPPRWIDIRALCGELAAALEDRGNRSGCPTSARDVASVESLPVMAERDGKELPQVYEGEAWACTHCIENAEHELILWPNPLYDNDPTMRRVRYRIEVIEEESHA